MNPDIGNGLMECIGWQLGSFAGVLVMVAANMPWMVMAAFSYCHRRSAQAA